MTGNIVTIIIVAVVLVVLAALAVTYIQRCKDYVDRNGPDKDCHFCRHRDRCLERWTTR